MYQVRHYPNCSSRTFYVDLYRGAQNIFRQELSMIIPQELSYKRYIILMQWPLEDRNRISEADFTRASLVDLLLERILKDLDRNTSKSLPQELLFKLLQDMTSESSSYSSWQMPGNKVATLSLWEPAQLKSTWTYHKNDFMWECLRKILRPRN